MESSSNMEHYRPPTTKLPFRNKRYHVFLSFRGPDVRKTLVDHLYEALSAAGLNVFLDSEKLEKGEMIGLSLERAMEGSAIRIPILSGGYADSVWCLKEAVAMVSTPGLIIPLFYNVDPTHVRYPEKDPSPYCQSFLKHYSHPDRYPREEVDKWKHALLQICDFSGWSMDISQGFEGKLVKQVVYDLIKTLDRVPLEVPKHPVGIDIMKNTFIQELHLNSVNGVIKVGIWGIGGIGKTTIAKALYNQLYADFQAASFLFNVRTKAADHKGLAKLQKKILQDLSKYREKVDSVDEGKSLLRDRLGGIRVLLIVDDVDDVEQLDALVGDWLAPGSRVIVTSRDKHVLNVSEVSYIREVGGLEIHEGLQLFSWHAFLRACPSPNYEHLSKGIVEACNGHPLALEVIGSFLYDKKDHTDCWREALSNITLNPDIQKRVHNTLKISYNALSDEEKEIFVDIACFFIGEDKTYPIVFWKSMYKVVDTAIFNLSMKLLIKIDDKGIFYMHDHLRDMGRRIAQTEKEGSRLWEATHLNTLYNNTNFSRFRLNEESNQSLEMLCSPGLRYLHLQNVHIEGMTEDTLAMIPPTLIWLKLEDCTSAIGMDGAVKKPRHSRVSGNIWQLKIMEVKGNMDMNGPSLPSLFSLPNIQLQHLNLQRCGGLDELPNTIGNLSQLRHLNLQECRNLNDLPDTIGRLSQLRHLNLEGCRKSKFVNLSLLEHFNYLYFGRESLNFDTIDNPSQLRHLEECRNDIIANLSQLRHLNLQECRNDTIANLSQLRHLNLQGCWTLRRRRKDTIANLSELQHLNLQGCWNLNYLSDTIGYLSKLQHLNLRGCWNLNSLPNTIGKLSELQHLNLEWCCRLDKLPHTIGKLSKLEHLNLENCINLNELPDTIGILSQLKHLNLKWCNRLNKLPDSISNLSQLRYLDLKWSGIDRPRTIGYLSDNHSTGAYRLEI